MAAVVAVKLWERSNGDRLMVWRAVDMTQGVGSEAFAYTHIPPGGKAILMKSLLDTGTWDAAALEGEAQLLDGNSAQVHTEVIASLAIADASDGSDHEKPYRESGAPGLLLDGFRPRISAPNTIALTVDVHVLFRSA